MKFTVDPSQSRTRGARIAPSRFPFVPDPQPFKSCEPAPRRLRYDTRRRQDAQQVTHDLFRETDPQAVS